MGKVAVSNRVAVRDNFGRFYRDIENAGRRTVERAIEEGADLSRSMAPSGVKPDPRTPKLKNSISTKMVSRTQGYWYSRARHALAIEHGARPHPLPANVSFWWEREGRMWMPPDVYERVTGYPGNDPIRHPGNAPQPFLRPAYEIIQRRIRAIMREEYPG